MEENLATLNAARCGPTIFSHSIFQPYERLKFCASALSMKIFLRRFCRILTLKNDRLAQTNQPNVVGKLRHIVLGMDDTSFHLDILHWSGTFVVIDFAIDNGIFVEFTQSNVISGNSRKTFNALSKLYRPAEYLQSFSFHLQAVGRRQDIAFVDQRSATSVDDVAVKFTISEQSHPWELEYGGSKAVSNPIACRNTTFRRQQGFGRYNFLQLAANGEFHVWPFASGLLKVLLPMHRYRLFDDEHHNFPT